MKELKWDLGEEGPYESIGVGGDKRQKLISPQVAPAKIHLCGHNSGIGGDGSGIGLG